MQWLEKANILQKQATDFVLVSILESHGSTPRKTGTKMLICPQEQLGSIGGGKLEWEVSKLALQMLKKKQSQKTQTYHLGAQLGQCCGGKVSVLLEGFFFEKKNIVIFGAGHIAQELIPILQRLECELIVVDTRKNFLEKITKDIKKIHSEYPQDEVAKMPHSSYYLIMTHEHNLDLAIAEQALKEKSFSFLGIVGSQKKSLRFRKLFLQKNYPQELVNTIYCPIGLDLGKTQKPSQIAISIAAQLVKEFLLNNKNNNTP